MSEIRLTGRHQVYDMDQICDAIERLERMCWDHRGVLDREFLTAKPQKALVGDEATVACISLVLPAIVQLNHDDQRVVMAALNERFMAGCPSN